MPILKHIICTLLLCVLNVGLFAGDGSFAIEKSSQEDRHLFIFFYKDRSDKTLKAKEIVDQVAKKLKGKANFVNVMLNDPDESDLIEKFDLKHAPLPLVMVIAPNGAVVGGFSSKFSKEKMIDSLASPKMAKCLKALQDKKFVFVCMQNSKTKNLEKSMKGVLEFKSDPRFAKSVEIVTIDPLDTDEYKFLSQLSVDTRLPQLVTILLAPPGKIIGNYKGATNKEKFINDLNEADVELPSED